MQHQLHVQRECQYVWVGQRQQGCLSAEAADAGVSRYPLRARFHTNQQSFNIRHLYITLAGATCQQRPGVLAQSSRSRTELHAYSLSHGHGVLN